jgi:hypothetical protein
LRGERKEGLKVGDGCDGGGETWTKKLETTKPLFFLSLLSFPNGENVRRTNDSCDENREGYDIYNGKRKEEIQGKGKRKALLEDQSSSSSASTL